MIMCRLDTQAPGQTELNGPRTSTRFPLSASVTNPFYIGNFTDLKASNPAVYNQIANLSTFSSKTISLSQLLKPYPWMTGLNAYTNLGLSRFNAMAIQYGHRFATTFQTTVNYQRTSQYDADWTPNAFDTRPGWEPSNNSRPSRLTATGRFELPFGRGRRWFQSGILSKILGGQSLDLSYEAQQGQLIQFGNIIYTGDPNKMKSSLQLSNPVYVVDPTKQTNYVQWLSVSSVDPVSSHQLGAYNLRVFPHEIDGVRQMGIDNFNANYQRTFSIRERIRFIARFECIDIFNHRVIGGPTVDPTSTKYGQVTGDNGAFARWIQIQGKITF